MATTTQTRKRQSARLDILALISAGGGSNRNTHNDFPASPTDSLSPCKEEFDQDERKTLPRSSNDDDSDRRCSTGPDEDDWFLNETACPAAGQSQVGLTDDGNGKAGTPAAQDHDDLQDLDLAFHVLSPVTETSSPATAIPPAREPRFHRSRSHRPATLLIDETHGASTLPACELKHAIQSTAANQVTTTDCAATGPPSSERGRLRHRRSAAVQLGKNCGIGAKMGNLHSHHLHAEDGTLDDSDTRSTQSVIRASRTKAGRVPRRSSINVFKRLDSKSPLPAEMTGTVIEVPRAATAPNLDAMADDEDDESNEHEQERSRARHAHRHSAPSPSIPVHPASPSATITEESAARPLSASDTITDHRPSSHSEQSDEEESPAHLRVFALSPTLPAPSPIPEDSPHKYGLKDRMDTPEAASPPPDIEVNKAKRRNSGLAIFNEAKTLQSASSFLNGLSTARRRAESRAQSRNATDNTTSANTAFTSMSAYTSATSSFIHLPASATTSTIHPYSSISQSVLPNMPTEADLDLDIDITNRNRGHQFKSSGFAYAPPLKLTQMRCYRSHTRLLPSRNKYASVECAVCHADDKNQFWSCSWCALRMCSGCRRVLEASGVAGLRDRVRVAEMGVY